MWEHDCPEEGKIEFNDDEPCSWCGAVKAEQDEIDKEKT